VIVYADASQPELFAARANGCAIAALACAVARERRIARASVTGPSIANSRGDAYRAAVGRQQYNRSRRCFQVQIGQRIANNSPMPASAVSSAIGPEPVPVLYYHDRGERARGRLARRSPGCAPMLASRSAWWAIRPRWLARGARRDVEQDWTGGRVLADEGSAPNT